MARISAQALNRATLARQGLLEPITGDPGAAVHRLTSLQAQHPEWPPVALASRASDATVADLARALADRTAVRSSLMRITIHVVGADDLWPMFTVCQPMRLNQWRLLVKADPIASDLGRRMTAAHATAVAALREEPRTSLELDRLMAAEVGPGATSVSRPAWRQPESQIVVRAAWRHFAAFVPLVHVPHSGEGYGRSRYALADSWLGGRQEMGIEDARVHVARRYLAAFGPASVDDLVAYAGRGPGGVGVWRRAVEALGDEVIELQGEGGQVLLDLAAAPRPGDRPTRHLDSSHGGTASCCRTIRGSADGSSPTSIGPASSRRTPTCSRPCSSRGSWPERGPSSEMTESRTWSFGHSRGSTRPSAGSSRRRRKR